jgi:hypothetical protein
MSFSASISLNVGTGVTSVKLFACVEECASCAEMIEYSNVSVSLFPLTVQGIPNDTTYIKIESLGQCEGIQCLPVLNKVTPTPTPTPTSTSTPTPTATNTPTPTPTSTPNCEFDVDVDNITTPTPTPTSTPTPTPTPTSTPTPTPTLDCVFDAEFSESEPIVIDENTQINIWFDNSGSMDSTLSPLQTMRDTILKNCLLQFYNNDSNLYDENVSVKLFSEKPSGTERTFFMLDTTGTTAGVTKVINLVFQDEAQSIYHSSSASFDINESRTSTYMTDITNFRNTLNALPSTYYRGVIFRVEGFEGFKQFIDAVRDGSGNYSGVYGLSDRSEIAYVSNVTAGTTPQYYVNQIITALNTLGYNLQAC